MLQMAGLAVARSGVFLANASKVLPSQSRQTSWIRCYDTNKAASEENTKPNKGYFGRDTIADAAAKIAPAVASLFAPKRGQNVGGEIGSGTAIHEDGYILTCAHVVFDTTNVVYSADGKVVVRLEEAEKEVEGHVVDAYADLDIAIVKIEKPTSPLSTAKVGSSSKLRPGDWAIAMGCPLSLQHTVTLGIISCVHRTSNELRRGGMMEYLQTDCAINPGNSGGPLCNVDGEVVGVNVETIKPDKASGVSFAVPVDFISTILKPFQNCHSECRKSSKLHDEGVERDFLQMDCSITQGNSGGPLFNIDRELVGIITSCSKTAPGMSFAIPVDNIRALLDPISKWNAVQPEPGWIIYDFYGMMINQKDPSFPDKQGVRVFKVRGGSSAEYARIKQGDLIVKFDGKPIDGDIRQIMDVLKKKYRQRINIVIQRENSAPRNHTILPEEKNHQAPRKGLVRSKI